LACKVQYKSSVFNDLKNIDKPTARRILDSIENELAEDPSKGISLESKFKGLFKFRVGSYRVVYARLDDGILILRVGHRKNVYRKK
jgi:mRNA interferase RelE/StbE